MNTTQASPATPPGETYGRAARVFHWATVALVAVQVPIGVYMVHRGKELDIWDSITGALYSSHKLIGVTLLALVLARLAWRLLHGAPGHEPTLERWQVIASAWNHWLLYALLIAVPVAGYVGISLFPALDVFGMPLPGVTAPDRDAAGTAFAVHGWLAIALTALVAVHVAAALYHHVVRRDGVLARMIPQLRRR